MGYHYLVNGKQSYYSIDVSDKEYLENTLTPIKDVYKDSKTIGGYESRKIHSLVLNLIDDDKFKTVLYFYYIEKQIGIKSLCKLLDDVISYSSMRGILNKLGILSKNRSHIYKDEQKKMRSYNAKNGITPHYPSTYTHQHLLYNSNKQGVQGYYFSKYCNKYIWIRSTYEYIVADYFDNNNIRYIYETIEYTLNDGRKYRPDFHILNDDLSVDKIIEIKSNYYLSHQDDKAFILKENFNNVFVLFNIEGICEYFNINHGITNKMFYIQKLKEWKAIRRTKNEI